MVRCIGIVEDIRHNFIQVLSPIKMPVTASEINLEADQIGKKGGSQAAIFLLRQRLHKSKNQHEISLLGIGEQIHQEQRIDYPALAIKQRPMVIICSDFFFNFTNVQNSLRHGADDQRERTLKYNLVTDQTYLHLMRRRKTNAMASLVVSRLGSQKIKCVVVISASLLILTKKYLDTVVFCPTNIYVE